MRQHTVRIRRHMSACVGIRQHTSAYVGIRQHTSAYVSIRQHTSAYVKNGLADVGEAELTAAKRGVVSGQRHTSTPLPNAAEGRDVHVIQCGASSLRPHTLVA